MRIGIEAKVLSPTAGGIGRYATNLVQSMLALGEAVLDEATFVLFTGPQTSRETIRQLRTATERYSPVKSSLLRSLLTLPSGIRRECIDLFHGLDHVGVPMIRHSARSVVTLHDIIPLEHPEWFSRKHRLVVQAAIHLLSRNADRVIVPSVSVKEDLLRRGLMDEKRIVVIPEGCEERFDLSHDPQRLTAVRQKYDLPEIFALFVGTLNPRKNLGTLLRALSLSGRPELALVVAGSPGWQSASTLAEVGKLRLQDRVRFTGFIDDADLPDLYRAAKMFVFPSLMEGFGLPVLEAMRCGTPVIASSTTSIPEVAGDAALLIDPSAADAWADALRTLLDDTTLATELSARGHHRAKQFTWEKTARLTMDLYAELLR
jgi:glycosyltransferase involved in cell wall biosynthesis